MSFFSGAEMPRDGLASVASRDVFSALFGYGARARALIQLVDRLVPIDNAREKSPSETGNVKDRVAR